MSSNNLILPGMSEAFYETWKASMAGPVMEIFTAGGTAYSNGDSVVFTRDSNDTETANAVGTVMTDVTGAIDSFVLTDTGQYSIAPTVSISSNTGTGANSYCTIDADAYYLFAAGVEPFSNEPTVDPVSPSVNGMSLQPHRQMLFGTRIDKKSLTMVVPTVKWTSNTVYAQYDDDDSDLSTKTFYVVNGSGRVYKCLNNAQGQPSTTQPTVSEALSSPPILADGYQWLYLYTLPSVPTTSFMTVIQEANTANSAVPGAIFSVKVVSSGSNYPSASGTILSTNANGAGSVTLSSPPSQYTNYFKGCYLTVWGNGGVVNNFSILSSTAGGNNQQITVAGSFNANQISSGYQFQIGPAVGVTGDGTSFAAYADVSPVNGGISDIHVLDAGTGYHYANASILSTGMFGSNAVIDAAISPLGGHGSNVFSDLFAKEILVSASFSNTSASFAPLIANSTVQYRSVGILRKPVAYQPNDYFTSTTFDQRVLFTFNPQATPFFQPGEIATGSGRSGQVVVVASNANTGEVEVVGWDGSNIQVGESVSGSQSGTVLTLNTITGAPSLKPFTGDVIYLSNFTAVTHSNTAPSDTFQILMISQ